MTPHDFTVPVPGGTISGRDFGGPGPDVILLHSVGYSIDAWAEFAPRLAEFARVAMFDMRGHGQSDCELEDPMDMVRDIPMVAQALGMEKPLVVAHMFGGGVAAILAATDRDFMGGLCLSTVRPRATRRHIASCSTSSRRRRCWPRSSSASGSAGTAWGASPTRRSSRRWPRGRRRTGSRWPAATSEPARPSCG